MKIKYFAAIITISFGLLWGYTVKGRVEDTAGEPVPAAHIYIPSEEIGTAADIDGFFAFDVPAGTHLFKITAVGYQDIETTLTIFSDTSFVFTLKSQAIKGEQVVVTASRVEQSILDIPISTTIAPGDVVSHQAITGFNEAIQHIPGVHLNRYQVSIRNTSGYSQGAGSRVVMLIDGVPVLSGDTGEIKWDALPTNVVSRVEVVKGAGSALYGSGAIGGVINIITLDPMHLYGKSDFRNLFRIFSKFGVYDKPHWDQWVWTDKTLTIKNGGFLWGRSNHKFYFYITGDITQSDGYRQGDDFLRGKSFGKFEYKLGETKTITAFVNAAYEDRANYFQWESPAHALNTEPGRENDRVWSGKMFSAVIYRGDNPAEKRFFTLKAYQVFNNWHSRLFNTDTREYEREHSQSLKAGAEGQITFTWDRQIITAGGEGVFSMTSANIFGEHIGWGGALFAQDEISYLHPLVFNLGGRFDFFWVDSASTEFFTGISPKLSAIYHITEFMSVHGSVASGFRIPTMAELFTRTNAGGILRVEPNPDLKPEHGYSSEIALNFARDGVIFSTAGFYNYFTDMIEPTAIYGTLVKFTNLKRTEIKGIEITASARVGKVFVSGGYTYTSSRDLDTGEKLPYRPDHNLKLSAEYSVMNNLTLGADFRYNSAPIYALYKGDPVMDAKVLDLFARWKIKNFRFDFRVNNATNYNYTVIERNLEPIRHFVLSVEYQWQN